MLPDIPYCTISEFINLKRLGEGAGGIVSVEKHEVFGQIAVKQFTSSQRESPEKCKKEIEILHKHRHPNIVHLYGILWNEIDRSIYLGYVMEYMKDGSLHDVIYNKEKSYNLREICIWIEQIALGLQFLHGKNIIHRDIKPANFLVDGDKLKLADFGIAKNVDGINHITTAGAGTYRYMAPEVMRGKSCTSSDVYSLAITVWEIFHRKIPYYEMGNVANVDLVNKILAGARPSIESNKMDEEMAGLVQKCWQENPSDRLSVKEIMNKFGERLSGQQMGSNTGADRNVSELQESMEEVTLPVNRNDVAKGFNTSEWKLGSISKQNEQETILIIGGEKKESEFAGMAVLSDDRSKWIELNLKLPHKAQLSGVVYLNGEIYLFGGANYRKDLYKLDKNMKWIQLADMNERRRYITNSCLEWNGYIWVFGGLNEKNECLKSVERYDPKENKWTPMSEMETARAWAATALWNDKIIISGGWDTDKTITNTMECFDPEVGCWVEFPNMPTITGGHSLVSYRNKLILIGGGGSEACNTVWELDPLQPNAEWKPLPPMKYPSCWFPGIVLDNEIYAIGGNQGPDLPDLSRVEIFDGERWRDGPSLPYTWRCMSSVIISQHFADRLCQFQSKTILIIGGWKNKTQFADMALLSADRSEWIELKLKLPYQAFGSGAVYLNGEIYLVGGANNPKALYKLDKNMEWIRLADMNEGRNQITNSCLEWNGHIWVFGGANENDEPLKSVERYDPKEDKWTQMPEMETVRASAATALWNDKIIISGGWIAEKATTKTMECFDLEDGCWVQFPHMPTASGGHSLVSYKNKLSLIGGKGKETYNTVWELDPQQTYSEWEPLPPMKHPSCHFAGIVLDNEIYTIGGYQGEDLPYLSRVEIFDGERWRDGPDLPYTWSFMAAVIIPQHFADRLCHFTKDNSNKCIVS